MEPGKKAKLIEILEVEVIPREKAKKKAQGYSTETLLDILTGEISVSNELEIYYVEQEARQRAFDIGVINAMF